MSRESTTTLYLDPSQPIAHRVQDLLARMTPDEKVSQLRNEAAAIPRLEIPAYNYWSEALHGVARNGRATVFPQAIGLAAMWDTDLIQRIASAIGDEGRAKYHEAFRRAGETGYCQGLHFWSPNVNIYRDPRWGRGQETYGEDPTLSGEIGAAFVHGLQGDNPRYLKAVACAKHYAVHSGPEKLRHGFDAHASLRDLHDTYLPAFKKLVIEAKVESVMGAYNRTNGDPCCAHPYLIGKVLRQDWEFDGHFVSDCGAVSDIYSGHKTAASLAEAAALALKQGCDLECGRAYEHLGEALEQGLITEADLDRALSRVIGSRFKLGMFDPPEQVPFAVTPMTVVGCDAHRQLAREAAAKSIVLLKNRNLLPFDSAVKRIHLTGPIAADVNVLLGNYYGINDGLTTILEGIAEQLPEGLSLEYRQGTLLNQPNTNRQDWLFGSIRQTDVVVACVGITPLMEGEEGDAIASTEEGDRTDLALPAVQVDFVRRLAKTGARIVLIVTGGGPIVLGDLADLVDAILFVWYPGQEGGHAVADILFGKAVPSGKLPITFPKAVDQLPPFDDYRMDRRTYRYMTADPLYPFGFGLSYTQFAYSDLQLKSATIQPGASLPLKVTLKNVGQFEADEVVQFYLSDLEASTQVPIQKLVGFQRITLKPEEQRTLEFTITPEMMMLIDDNGQAQLEPGQFRVTVGGCSPGTRGVTLGAPQPISALFTVH